MIIKRGAKCPDFMKKKDDEKELLCLRLIIFLVFSWGVITIKGIDITDRNAYAVLAFLAGFSEPFYTGILDRVAGKAGNSLR